MVGAILMACDSTKSCCSGVMPSVGEVCGDDRERRGSWNDEWEASGLHIMFILYTIIPFIPLNDP